MLNYGRMVVIRRTGKDGAEMLLEATRYTFGRCVRAYTGRAECWLAGGGDPDGCVWIGW